MKLRFLPALAFAFLFVIAASSCTREYICQCTIKYSGQPGLPDSSVKEYPITDTKDKAKSTCEANSGTYVNGAITAEENCHLY